VLSPSPAGQTKKEVPTFQKFVDEVWWSTYPARSGTGPARSRKKEIHLRLHLKPTLGRLTLDKIRGEVVGKAGGAAAGRVEAEAQDGQKHPGDFAADSWLSAVEWNTWPRCLSYLA